MRCVDADVGQSREAAALTVSTLAGTASALFTFDGDVDMYMYVYLHGKCLCVCGWVFVYFESLGHTCLLLFCSGMITL